MKIKKSKNNRAKSKRSAVLGLAALISLGAAVPAIHSLPVYAAESPAPVAGHNGQQDDVTGLKGQVTISGIRTVNSAYSSGQDGNANQKTTNNPNITVKITQIVDGYYTDTNKDGQPDSLSKYVLIDPENGKIANLADQFKGADNGNNDMITSDELTTIANNIESNTFDVTKNKGKQITTELHKDGNTWTSSDKTVNVSADGDGVLTLTTDLEPGLYAVTVASDNDIVYNPAVVAVNLSDANEETANRVKAGAVNLMNAFSFGTKDAVNDIYLKSSASGMDKKIVNSDKTVQIASNDKLGIQTGSDTKPSIKNENGDTVAYGDKIAFKIDGMKLPSFSADYEDPEYIIEDTLDADAFAPIQTLDLTVGNKKLTYDGTTKTFKDGETTVATITDGIGTKHFKIAFAADYLKAHTLDTQDVVVDYTTALSDTAGVNFAENKNHAVVTYSNDPTDSSKHKTVKKTTYHYTFAIDGLIDGQRSTQNPGKDERTHDFDKVTKAKDDYQHISDSNYTKTSVSALAGAQFTLFRDEACKTPVKVRAYNTDGSAKETNDDYTSTSDDGGLFTFTGLDEGTYYVKETKAPKGYTLNDTVYRFVIQANLDASGVLKDYTITTQSKSVKDDADGNTAGENQWVDAGKAHYTATYTLDNDTGDVTNTTIKADDGGDGTDIAPVEVVDTRLQTLPSTGGIGLYLILGASGAIALAGVGMKKKKQEA